MDDTRKSLSGLKKDLKHRLGGARAPDGTGASATGEKVGSSVSLLHPDSCEAAGGHNE